MDESDIEREIEAKGLTAPRVKLEDVYRLIVEEAYYIFPGTTVTVCCLTLKNGFTVVDSSACVSPENFNEELGRKAAKERARSQIWELEGYLLKQEMFDAQFRTRKEKP
jgi:hypothetical protein